MKNESIMTKEGTITSTLIISLSIQDCRNTPSLQVYGRQKTLHELIRNYNVFQMK